MKKTNGYRIWQIIYPIGLYYAISSIMYYALEMLLGSGQETYMLRQLICAATTIPFILKFYRQDKTARDTVYGVKKFRLDTVQIKNILFAILSAAAAGIAVNNIIAMTPLIRMSQGFTQANESFFGGSIIFELAGSCLLIPIAEELLFRGVVYQRIKLFLGLIPGIVFSALIFGIVHVNLVQFLYATILGLLLAFLFEKTGYFYVPVLGHIAANTVAVIRSETGWLNFAYEPTVWGIGFTILMLVIAAVLTGYMVREYNSETI